MHEVVLAKNLVKQYADFTAVNKINFAVQPGECFGFLGPNGAGKSTTVRMIYCFSPITSGQLLVLGQDVQHSIRAIKARLGVVAQEDNLDPDLTVRQNLLVFASYFKIPKAEVAIRSDELLAFFDLTHKANTQVEELSGGMKRRLAIARALINRPELLILDEPTTGLDPQARHLVWQKLRSLKNQGVTLLLTTHYMDEATQLCDRLVIMNQGNILEEGQPKELIARHIGKEVLQLTLEVEQLNCVRELLLKATSDWPINGQLVVGEALFLFTNQGETLAQLLRTQLQSQGLAPIPLALRPATLEDVFLKLTGRGLDFDEQNSDNY